MISGGSASTNNSSSSSSNSVGNTTTTTTIPASTNNSNDVVVVTNNNNNTSSIQQPSSLTSFLTSQTGSVNNNNNNTTTTTILASGESPQQASHHVIIGSGGSTTSLLPPLAKSTPQMTSTTLNGTSAANQSSHSSTITTGGGSSSSTTNTSQFVPIAPATSNQPISLLSVPSAHTSDHATEHHKSISSNPSLNVSVNNLPPNVTSSQQARSPKPVQVGFMPPVSLCVLMEQMASKIQQHYQPQKQTSSSKKSELSSQKKDVAGESSSTLNSNTEDAKKTEMSTDDKTNNQSNETNANVISTSRNVSSTSQGRSRSPGSNSTPSLYDILNDEYHSNYSNYQELIHATNLIVEFLYGNTDLRERYHPFHSQFSSQQNPSFSWVYVLPPGMIDQNSNPPPMPAVPRAPPTYAHSGLANQHSTPVKSGRGVPRSDTTPNSNFKPGSSTTGYDPLEIPPPVFAMPKPSNGSSEASTPMRVRIAPNSAGGTAILPMPEHQHISPFPIRAKEEDLMEEDKRRRRIGKKPETQEGGIIGNDEQENKFVCYICDKSVVDKSTKYTLTSSNFSSFHEVFPHLKAPLLGESKRICANCYHKKYRNSRKKKADDRKDVISQGSSNVMSVDESYEPTYCCCVCKKNGSEEFTETNFVNVQNYRSYLTYFPFISDTPTADRQLPVCDLCHANYLQADIQEKKRKFMHMMPNIPNTVETLESLNKKLKPDTSHL